jgi:signal transduction histidine kinase
MEREPKHERTERALLGVGSRGRFGLGPVGLTAAVAGVAAVSVAIALGLIIPNIVERHLLEASVTSIHDTVHEIADPIRPASSLTGEDLGLLQSEVERSLLGREIVRVKIWDRSGTIVFSDEARLIGSSFPVSDDLRAAFSGELISEEPDLTKPENVFEIGLGELREYYVPVDGGPQGTELVFEVYELADNLVETIIDIRNAVWVALGIGAAALLLALTIAAITNARSDRRQKTRSERLISQLIEIRDDERTRIIGALHDDIGQPLYRILFGLQASRGMVDEGSDVDEELARLDALVRDVDMTLRSELTTLRDEPGVEIDLESALAELVEVTESTTELDIDFVSDVDTDLPLAHRATLYRAAKEALANVDRHAHADRVTMRLMEGRENTMLEVVDDGAGPVGLPGLGLTTTRDRLEALGGGVDLTTAKRGGTRFVAWVPIDRSGAE